MEALLQNRVRGFEFIAKAWADYERARANALGTALQYKSHPALSAAREVRAKGKEIAAVRREAKLAESACPAGQAFPRILAAHLEGSSGGDRSPVLAPQPPVLPMAVR